MPNYYRRPLSNLLPIIPNHHRVSDLVQKPDSGEGISFAPSSKQT